MKQTIATTSTTWPTLYTVPVGKAFIISSIYATAIWQESFVINGNTMGQLSNSVWLIKWIILTAGDTFAFRTWSNANISFILSWEEVDNI